MAEGRRWPLTLIRRGERAGSSRPDYVWWQELPADTTAESARSVGYEVVDVVPASALAKARTEAEQLKAGLRQIADTDWTQPPGEMPEEIAQSALDSLTKEEG